MDVHRGVPANGAHDSCRYEVEHLRGLLEEYRLTPYQATEAMRQLLDEMHKRYVPDEERDRNARGALGFDYGYQQALYEVGAKLYLVFPEINRGG
jgi:hypothetical protein